MHCALFACDCSAAHFALCSYIKKGCHIIWLDNFSKYRFKQLQIPNLQTGTYHKMLWTGSGLRRSHVQVEMGVMRDGTGQVVPAMPDQPFDYLDSVRRRLEKCKAVHKRHMYRHDTCMVTRFQVNTVPPMPALEHLEKPRHRRAVETHVSSHTSTPTRSYQST